MNLTTTAALLTILAFSGAAHDDIPQPSRTIEVHAHRFAFEPAEITVKQGETVRLELVSDDVPHSLVVKELGIDETASKAHPGDVDFKATQAGDFAGRCGRFCGAGHGHMTFTVHVAGE
jgi:cytochrome c oxidase subunit 2